MKKVCTVMLLVILCTALAACGDTASRVTPAAPTPAQSNQPTQTPTQNTPSVTEASEPTPAATPESQKYKAGTYKVGSDIPAGEYVLLTDSFMSYFQISSDSSGTLNSIIANDNFDSNSIVTISDGQYFEMTGCYAVPIEEVTELDSSGEGMFKVGYFIPAGEYKLEVDEGTLLGYGYVEIASNSTHTLNSIITNDNFEGSKYITVSNGQYMKLSGCHITSRPDA